MVEETGYTEENGANTAHFQVSFFSSEERLKNLPGNVFNVPASSGPEQFNNLINKTIESVQEDWQEVLFDFLINRLLLRSSLLEFVENNDLTEESVIKIECILREPAPIPDQDYSDNEWISGVKTNNNTLFSVNYGGELSLWSLNNGKLLTNKVDSEALKCIDLLKIDNEQHVVVGGQSQSLTLLRIESNKNGKKTSYNVLPVATLRGHQRSVECVAAKLDGTKIVSGGFDNCLKVWDTSKENEENTFERVGNNGKNKRVKLNVQTKVPMVTLETHREAIVDVKWNPLNETQVLTVSWDHTMINWDLEIASSIASMSSNKAFSSLSVNSKNGLVITGSTDLNIRLWDLRSNEGSMVKQLYLGHRGWVSDVCWSPDSENLFVSSGFDNSVKMWDSRSSKAPLYDLIGHDDRVLTVDWSNNAIIASGSADSTIKTFKRAVEE